MKKKIVLLAFLAGNLAGALAQGSGNSIDFGANAATKNHVDLGTYPIDMTTQFSMEFWYHADNVSGDPSILSNKDWGSGNNTGINIAIQGGGSDIDINFKGADGPRADMNITGVDFSAGWNHIAITFDRSSNMIAYVNGIQMASEDISGATGTLLSGMSWKLGQDGTGTYGGQINGEVDELRVWNGILSEADIRTNMCQEITVLPPNLVAYYQFNETTGSSVADETGNFNGTLVSGSDANWMTSGAAIGNMSAFNYSTDWTGVTLNLNNADSDFTVANISGADGVHLYRVDASPSNTQGISTLNGTDEYYGVFFAGATTASADLTWDYSLNATATGDEANILLFGRANNNSAPWNDLSATVNMASDIAEQTISTHQEVILGYQTTVCNDPTNLMVNSTTTSSAEVTWTSNDAANWTIEYGPIGFTPGSGTTMAVSSSTETIPNLTPSTDYDFYVTANCGGTAGNSNAVGPVQFTTDFVPPGAYQGSAMAINFDNSGWIDASNGNVTAASLGLPAQTLTVECWVYVREYTTWDAMVAFIQDNGNFEKGWDLEVRDNNKFAFALSTNGDLTYLETNNQFATNRWYHVAGTYDGTTQKIYVNGQLENETTANSGDIDYADSWLALGSYKDDNESNLLNGKLDEVRIWNSVRTPEQLRDFMCKKLAGNESDLVAYYPLDQMGGTSVTDASGNLADGVFSGITETNRVISGAPIGDESDYLYEGDWSTESVSISSANNGTAEAKVVSGSPNGIHIYRVNGTPLANSTTPVLNGTDDYFGVYVSDINPAVFSKFQLEHNYASFADAVTNENELILLNRLNKNGSWTINDAEVNTTSDMVISDTNSFRKEYVFSTNANINCNVPTGITMTDQSPEEATITWTNGGSGISNVQWGTVGFEIGEGTIIPNITNETSTFGSLMQDEAYEFYVQDSCASENSPWVGPFLFTGEQCMVPSNISVDNITATEAEFTWDGANGSDWTISWGADLTNPDWGIQTVMTSSPETLTGLVATTEYTYYMRSNCSGGNSPWVGPFTFTTADAGVGIEETTIIYNVYPNPAKGEINVQSAVEIDEIVMSNLAGQQIKIDYSTNGTITKVYTNELSSGTYLLTVKTEKGNATTRVMIK